jgi:Flp pilus assembly protein CpaB
VRKRIEDVFPKSGQLRRLDVPLPVDLFVGLVITDQLLMEFTTIGILVEDRTARQAVATIAAPVFDDRSRVGMIVAVHPLQALTRKRMDAVGGRAAQVASAISGR